MLIFIQVVGKALKDEIHFIFIGIDAYLRIIVIYIANGFFNNELSHLFV